MVATSDRSSRSVVGLATGSGGGAPNVATRFVVETNGFRFDSGDRPEVGPNDMLALLTRAFRTCLRAYSQTYSAPALISPESSKKPSNTTVEKLKTDLRGVLSKKGARDISARPLS